MSASKPAFVLVHGAWHDHWSWHKVVPILEANGHAAHVEEMDDGEA